MGENNNEKIREILSDLQNDIYKSNQPAMGGAPSFDFSKLKKSIVKINNLLDEEAPQIIAHPYSVSFIPHQNIFRIKGEFKGEEIWIDVMPLSQAEQ